MLFDIDIRKQLPAFKLDIRLHSDAKKLVLIGASGSGKSLTLRLIAGLLKPDSGHIRINGQTWFDHPNHLPAAQRKAGLMFQDYALFPHLTVAQNIAFGLHHSWLNPPKRPSENVRYWLNLMQLTPFADCYPHQISGGQKQRTALARTLATQPQLLLLDEPFSALDTELRRHTRQELLQLQQANGIPMILITHDPADTEIADEVWRMENGRLSPSKA
ncbi:sulfate/molybdate ABC transporter ATP-binding protein [Neisseria zalophi]|uniref:ATP-binding cassette domain-containing protein n=1 Tax=Neisseria zalophi TaxID=640030 RepID=A0A5J6Q0J8_9NEIS|nr:ATP-binding cassette domain-containing protein [Neisseria zalophi]QEY26450.1 ATP-binding cassette domain-containing protein [Neisseria zalophi]